MTPSPRPREAISLSDSLHQRLNMYALVASAAGVAALALSRPAEAKIVYTPADIHIRVNGALVKLDLDHNGITDVSFRASYFSGNGYLWLKQRSKLAGAVSHTIVRQHGWVAALPKGQEVGPEDPFVAGYPREFMHLRVKGAQTSFSYGFWGYPERAYVGLKFGIKGKVHYGWVRVEMLPAKDFHYPALITGYAYETIPGKSIITGATKASDDGEPAASFETTAPPTATLGALALGTPGLSIWRREDTDAERVGHRPRSVSYLWPSSRTGAHKSADVIPRRPSSENIEKGARTGRFTSVGGRGRNTHAPLVSTTKRSSIC